MKLRRPRLPPRPMMVVGAILAVGLGMTGSMMRRPSTPGPEGAGEPRGSAETRVAAGIPTATHPLAGEFPHMLGPRPSIMSLFQALALLTIGVACLRSPSSPWAGTAVSALLAFLMIALVGITCRRGPRRAYAYLTVSLGPWFEAAVRPALVTTKVIRWAYPLVIPEGRQLPQHRPSVLTSPVRLKNVDMTNLDRGPLDVRIEAEGDKSKLPLVHDIEVAAADGDGPVIGKIVLLADREQLARPEQARCEGASFVLSRHAAGPFASLLSAPPVSELDLGRVGHAFCGIVLALAGGAVGLYFSATNDHATQGV